MADEIKLTVNGQMINGNFRDYFRPAQITYTMSAATGGNPGTVTVGTSEENIVFGDVAPGLVIIHNLDATNFVTFGQDNASTMQPCGEVGPGRVAVFELATSQTLRMAADTAAVNCLIKGYPVS